MNVTENMQKLDALRPRVDQHLPDMTPVLSQLIAEMNVILRRGLETPRSGLDLDLENLVAGLDDVCRWRAAGVNDTNIQASVEALRLLAMDMRARTKTIIQDHTALVRVNTECAKPRILQDAESQDMTTEYRLLAAVPSDQKHVSHNEIIAPFPLPPEGGIAGRAEGDMIILDYDDPRRHDIKAAPVDTVFLPAGRCVAMREGEQVVVRVQGTTYGEQILHFKDFRDHQSDILIEARFGGVILHGPATLCAHQGPSLKPYHMQLDAVLAAGDSLSSHHRDSLKSKKGLMEEFSPAFGLLAVGLYFVAYVISDPDQDPQKALRLQNLGFICAGVVSMSVLTFFTSWWTRRRCHSRLTKSFETIMQLDTLNTIRKMVGRVIPKTHYDLDEIKKTAQRIRHEKSVQFYAARTGVARSADGLKIVSPLSALPAPKMDPVSKIGNTTC